MIIPLVLLIRPIYNFYSINNGSKNFQKYTPEKSHKHAAECLYTFRIVRAQEVGLLHMSNRKAILKKNKPTRAKQW